MGRFNSQPKMAILEAAAAVFAEHGVQGATTRLVGRQAGVNSALIYYYFENKDALLAECTRFALGEFLAFLGTRRRPFTGAPDRLRFLVNGIFDYWSAHPDRLRLIVMMLTLHPDRFGQALKTLLGEQPPVPLEVLQEGIAAGELKPMHPLQAWWSMMGLCVFSLQVRELLPHLNTPLQTLPFPPPDLARRQEEIVELLLNGWLPASPRKKK